MKMSTIKYNTGKNLPIIHRPFSTIPNLRFKATPYRLSITIPSSDLERVRDQDRNYLLDSNATDEDAINGTNRQIEEYREIISNISSNPNVINPIMNRPYTVNE